MRTVFPDPVAEYDALVAERPELFLNPSDAMIELVTAPDDRKAIEARLAERYEAEKLPRHWACAGKFYEDPWLMVVRDMVRFPDDRAGSYHRILLKDGADSVVIVPRYRDDFILVRHFRHALRGWSLELPRGHVGEGMSVEQAVTAELGEEIGGEVTSVRRLGMVQSDTSFVFNPMHVYEAELSGFGGPGRAEGIASLHRTSLKEFRALVGNGQITDVVTVAAFAYVLLSEAGQPAT